MSRCAIGAWLAAFAFAVVSTACSGPATTSVEQASAAPTAASTLQVPEIAEPLDASGLASCSMLGAERLRRLGLDESTGRDYSTNIATGCAWVAVDGNYMSSLGLRTDAGVQLAYDLRDSFPSFEEEEVDGYPAVHLGSPSSVSCQYWVGIAETQSFNVEVRNLTDSSPSLCGRARAMASEFLDALRK
ncbi:DUF3558 family protein [Pseudonocardia halophobica]|uniref:DUF3558 family protein n=1 Tax=Pseudonocardia halophobica TaxID=29401 RepID=UPI0009DCB723